MRTLFTLFLTLSVLISIAQQKSQVLEVANAPKNDLYAKSLEWVAKTWKSANDVVQMKDQEAGTIIVKGGLASTPKSLGIPTKGMTFTTVTIRVKDGKAKIDFDGIYFKHDYGKVDWDDKSTNTGQYKKWKESTSIEIDSLIKDFESALNKKVDDF